MKRQQDQGNTPLPGGGWPRGRLPGVHIHRKTIKVHIDSVAIDRDSASTLLEAARGGRVLVVGDAMLDVYLTGRVDRISPEAPVPVLRVEQERDAPGGAANVAVGVAALGAQCRLVAAVGEDATGQRISNLLEAVGVPGEDLVALPGRPTTSKTRLLARHQQMLRVDREDPTDIDAGFHAEIRDRAMGALEWADALVLQDYDKGVVTPELSRALLERSRERGIPSIVDPKLRHFFDFSGATVFKPNSRELAAALGLETAPRSAEALQPLIDRLECEYLLLTLGEEGMMLVSVGGGVTLLAPEAREVFDVTGAGDTVTAVLAVAMLAGASAPQAAGLANVAAGIEVTHLGAVPISGEELLSVLQVVEQT